MRSYVHMHYRKRSTSIALGPDIRRKIEDAREKLALGTIRPSMGSVVREAITRGLPLVLSDAQHIADSRTG